MYRFGVTMAWGLISAVLVYATNEKLFTGLGAGALLAVVLGGGLWLVDSAVIPNRRLIRMANLPVRLGLWFTSYHVLPAAVIWGLATATGLFVLPVGYATALAMCVPISLITLSEFVDLSWLSRIRQ